MKHGLSYLRCKGCTLVYADVSEFDYQQHNLATSRRQLHEHERKHTGRRHVRRYQRTLAMLARYRETGRLLEVGCSTGGFLTNARAAGWSTTGIEPAGAAAAIAREKHSLDVKACTLAEAALPANAYDCAYANAVLEHLADPLRVVSEVFRVLRPGGVLYADTVNLDSYTWRFLGQQWRLVDPRAHLSLFTPQTLSALCERSGLEVVRMRSHGVRFRTSDGPGPGPAGRWLEELRKAPYSFAARHNLKGDSIAVLARKPDAS